MTTSPSTSLLLGRGLRSGRLYRFLLRLLLRRLGLYRFLPRLCERSGLGLLIVVIVVIVVIVRGGVIIALMLPVRSKQSSCECTV